MIKIKNINLFKSIIDNNRFSVFYTSDPLCILCQDMKPKIENLESYNNLDIYEINISENALLRGQLNLFTSPMIIMFFDGKEVYRQGRFLNIDEIEEKIHFYKKL